MEIEKNGKTLSLIVAYSEFSRKGFPVDRKAFTAGVCREFARARRRGNDSYAFVLWDANIRVACDVERFYELHPIARGLSPEGLCDVLMSDDLPHETENTMYRYLIAISRLRLGILTERGEGS